MATHKTVFVDADNTLWDTDAVYASAQLELLVAVESKVAQHVSEERLRLDYVREIDQSLAEKHHAGLKYPPRLLVRATAFALTGKRHSDAARLAWSDETAPVSEQSTADIAETFSRNLGKLAELRAGVRQGVDELAMLGARLIVVTEGSSERTKAAIEKHGLLALDQVIQMHKDVPSFLRIAQLAGPTSRAFMVGDQLQRDIAPAKTAGFCTIYFPGGFRPRWEPDEAVVMPDFRIDRFDKIPAIVARAN